MDDIINIISNHNEIKTKRKTIKKALKGQKLILCERFQELKNIDLETPLYSKLKDEEISHMLKIAYKLKEENSEVYIFACKLLKKVGLENMRNFMKNAPFITIQTHPLTEAPKAFNGKINIGMYSVKDKIINIYTQNNKPILYHELLHAASSDFSYNVCGFSTSLENNYPFGIGLNEGYTELLNGRLFNLNSYSYLHLQKLAELIEMFYENKEDMITDYFNADIFGLIGELLKSMSLEEAIDIIIDIDECFYYDQIDTNYINLKQKIINLLQKSPIAHAKNLNISKKEKVLSRTI